MAYSQLTADRVRLALTGSFSFDDKRMFGSLGFMIKGNLVVCVRENNVMYRIGPELTAQALKSNDAEPVIMKTRVMKGWVYISNEKIVNSKDFDKWLQYALDYNALNHQ
jgi:TfoX/Sxy family transcriptional regulator of competence genes